ncbi:MAG: glycosyltransferase [Bacteroidales bacterium]|nr:glycosyltransferase [Bacteroidales bacterium]
MISFIIIGRNEEKHLPKCLKSVFETIIKNSLRKFEVLYVDSQSTDNSTDVVKKYPFVKIIQLTGDVNSAVARNVGAKESKGNVLFFIDGDMEIVPSFLELVYSESGGMKYSFVSGQFVDIENANSSNYIGKAYHKIEKNFKKQYTTGGLFLISKRIWDSVGGMRNKLKRNQDIDFGIRLAGNGVFLIRLSDVLAYHYTISYRNPKRMFKLIYSGDDLYRCELLRNNFLNKYQWRYFLRENYTMIFLIIATILAVITNLYISLFGYLAIIIIRVITKTNISFWNRILVGIYYLARDLCVFMGIFFFWPRIPKNITYKFMKS